MVASAQMSPRTPTTSLTFHYTYNAMLDYNNPLVYEPNGTNGLSSVRAVLASLMDRRAVATSSMVARSSTADNSSMTNRSVSSATMKGR